MTVTAHHRLAELKGLYRGVVGAASGAGIIIGTYFAFYSTTKRFLRSHSNLNEGTTSATKPLHTTFSATRICLQQHWKADTDFCRKFS